MARPEKKNLDNPDQRVELEGVAADVVQVGDASISRNVYDPGGGGQGEFHDVPAGGRGRPWGREPRSR
jgi:hypothetical protein